MKILFILSAFLITNCVKSQGTVDIPEGSDILEFVIQVERVSESPNIPNPFICVGTLLTLTHILTPRDVYDLPNIQVTEPSQLVLRFHGNRIGQGFRGTPDQIIRNANADLAILRMGHRIDQQLRFSPRRRDILTWDRFCTFYGFNRNPGFNNQLVATAALVRNATHCATPFCGTGTPNLFNTCGGFVGAPVTCDGSAVSAIVVRDHFCNASNPHVNLFRLEDQTAWINTQTSGAKISTYSSAMSVILGIILMKIFV